MTIRPATADDLPTILDIHNDAVLTTTAIWDEEPVNLTNRLDWFEARKEAGFPVLVGVEEDGSVAGYASYGEFRPRVSYRHTVENSVYVHPDHRRRGWARRLLTALIDDARRDEKAHVMLALIESGNTVSIDLHTALGFTTEAHLPEVGRKFDRWLDLTIMRLGVG